MTRATVRYRIDPAPPSGQPPLTDAVGEVVVNSATEIILQTRHGRVRIPRELVVATRIIPPPAARRGRLTGGALTPLRLLEATREAWPALEVERIGEWYLRASSGFTARSNSVLPVGDPGCTLQEALDHAEAWYAGRGLPANLTVAAPLEHDPRDDPLARLALERGYAAGAPTLFMTAPTGAGSGAQAAGARASGPWRVELSEALEASWLAAFDSYRSAPPAVVRRVLTGSPWQAFATVRDRDGVVGIGRIGGDAAWAGIAAMWVEPAARRRGVANALLAGLRAAAAERGIPAVHLQVWADNAPARALYEQAGFRGHHHYRNLVRPAG